MKKRPPDTQNKSGRPPTTLRRNSGEATQGKLRCSLSDRVVNAAAGKSGFPPALVAPHALGDHRAKTAAAPERGTLGPPSQECRYGTTLSYTSVLKFYEFGVLQFQVRHYICHRSSMYTHTDEAKVFRAQTRAGRVTCARLDEKAPARVRRTERAPTPNAPTARCLGCRSEWTRAGCTQGMAKVKLQLQLQRAACRPRVRAYFDGRVRPFYVLARDVVDDGRIGRLMPRTAASLECCRSNGP